MTDMYDEKKVPDFTLPPYPHEDHGAEVSYYFGCDQMFRRMVYLGDSLMVMADGRTSQGCGVEGQFDQ